MEIITVQPAAARELLIANDLPVDDLDDPSITLVGTFDGPTLVGVVGLQMYDRAGLLRSLAVGDSARSRGIARALCQRVISLATERGFAALWLLTMTARDYFARLGFEVVDRATVPGVIRQSAQFTSLCPDSAIVMRRVLAAP